MADALARLTAALADQYRIEREIGAERFLSEIKTTANLQHPHILPLHDSGQVDGTVFYVMPYIAGESLRERLTRDKQMPVEDAVRIAREVADALGYAHDHGIIHRDIKPENNMLQGDHALVADFGIALATSTGGGNRLTETGMSLGTPHYMSPEQAMGERTLGARSDIYALGCVLYEMLAGEPPFTGPTAQAIIARVMTETPRSLSQQRHTIPSHVEGAVTKALEKLPADRFASAAQFAAALADVGATYPATMGATSPSAAYPSRSRRLAVAVVVAMAGLAILGAWGWLRPQATEPVRRYRVMTDLPQADLSAPAISPDGSVMVQAGPTSELNRYRRDALAPTPIAGTMNAWTPAFSPDGHDIVFGVGFPGPLRRSPFDGGSGAVLVADSVYGHGLAWGTDGWIYYSASAAYGLGLRRVRADGGKVEVLAAPDSLRDELFFLSPTVAPGVDAVVFTIWRRTGQAEVAVLDLANRRIQVLTAGIRAAFVDRGRLLAIIRSDGTLAAAPFDRRLLQLGSPPVTVETGVTPGNGENIPPLTVSDEGTLVHTPSIPPSEIVRVERDGRATALGSEWKPDQYLTAKFSPDGDRIAYAVMVKERLEVWVRDLRTGVGTRLASLGQYSYRPSWAAGGREVLFISNGSGGSAAYRVPADGSGPPHLLFKSDHAVDEVEMSRDGRWLVYRVGSGGSREIFARRVTGDTTPIDLLDTGVEEFAPTLSPDGHWLAYSSFESGREQVYVRDFNHPRGARWQVSPAGGREPRWAPDGRTLSFRTSAGDLVTTAVEPGPTFRLGASTTLLLNHQYAVQDRHSAYDVSPKDGSLLMVRLPSQATGSLVVVTNWVRAADERIAAERGRPR